MKILAFDCSTGKGGVAVIADGATLFAERFDCPRGRGGEFFLALDRAVRATGRPDRVAVGVGPGSYNGLRASIAAAEGLHLSMGAAMVGIASPRALPCGDDEYFALGDARGGVFWLSRIGGRQVRGEIELLPLAALLERLDAEPSLPRLAAAILPGVPGLQAVMPDPEILARLAESEPDAMRDIEPLYLKPAHITKARARA
ncbi:MAG: tRNA (adenosine(37)-N6)-threonylcarbamoyltransferase complex dimerization subunit type 1 TsaB [Terrimicrobiaceae bacterium]|nr:tRNA (adenosine(37)-N6)-threonylcarbamoyltransferase complex dimerization subunit type 1 TsaB [Terrimicrobiaceae bacterium]